jgi:hypothetical protein
MFLTIVTVIATLTSAFMVVLNYWRIRGETIRQCFEYFRNEDFIKAREYVQKDLPIGHNVDYAKINSEDKFKILLVISTMQQWGILVRKHYLPLSLFINSDEGNKVYNCYEVLKDYILYRKSDKTSAKNDYYADDFRWLYKRIAKYYD